MGKGISASSNQRVEGAACTVVKFQGSVRLGFQLLLCTLKHACASSKTVIWMGAGRRGGGLLTAWYSGYDFLPLLVYFPQSLGKFSGDAHKHMWSAFSGACHFAWEREGSLRMLVRIWWKPGEWKSKPSSTQCEINWSSGAVGCLYEDSIFLSCA